ncbi:MAG TPA: hypothetical protein VN446_02040 [Candidatus Acidoferrum sp.]|nr:hypothetical protein [Candidatus Acidoferrum sp.]
MNMNVRPAFRYQFFVFLQGAIVMFLIMTAIITAFMTIAFAADEGTSIVSFSGYGLSTTIFMFVMGIVNVRSDLRLSLQFGVSRRTSFICEVLAALSVSALLAAGGEVINSVARAVSDGRTNIIIADLYQLLYVGGNGARMSVSQHAMSMLFNTAFALSVCMLGMFFSLMFWRLNKFWTVVAALAIPVVINGGPMLLYMMGFDFIAFGRWLGTNPLNFMACFAAVIALAGLVDWLLLRKANILAAK